MKLISQCLFNKNRAISFTCAHWSRAMVDAFQSKAKKKKKETETKKVLGVGVAGIKQRPQVTSAVHCSTDK